MLFLSLQCIALLLVSYQVRVDGRLSLLEKAGITVFSPFQAISDKGADILFTLLQKRRSRAELESRNKMLEQQIINKELIEYQLNQTKRDNKRLRDLLDMKAPPDWELIHCDVTGRSEKYGDSIFLINKGSQDGLKVDMGVICSDGVVGITWEVAPFSSKVITVKSPGAIVAAMTEDSEYMDAYSSGQGLTSGTLENVPNFLNIQVGVKILTSGMDSLFPKGLPLGVVSEQQKTSQMFQQITINYLVDLSHVQEVSVLFPSAQSDGDP